MKKFFILSLLAFALAGSSLFAQKQLYFGVGGTGMSTWFINQNTYDSTILDWDVKSTFSYSVNANIGFDFNKNLGVKLELGYARLGQNYTDEFNADTLVTKNISVRYFQLPVLFKFRSSGEVAKFIFAIGPQFEFLMDAKQYIYINDVATDDWGNEYVVPGTTEKVYTENIKERFNSMDIMARLDLGVEIVVIKNLFIDAGLSFAYGLTDINADAYQSPGSDGNYNPVHNTYVGFNIGVNYVLPIGK
jgi:hypothetical protein